VSPSAFFDAVDSAATENVVTVICRYQWRQQSCSWLEAARRLPRVIILLAAASRADLLLELAQANNKDVCAALSAGRTAVSAFLVAKAPFPVGSEHVKLPILRDVATRSRPEVGG
jgi:hypothetical protein